MMNRLSMFFGIAVLAITGCGCNSKNAENPTVPLDAKKVALKIIVGSTRKGRTGDKVAKEIQAVAAEQGIDSQIIDLQTIDLPMFNEEIPPASRKEILDPVIQKWSDIIQSAQAFIIVVPEYNAGYPGVLKNALDSLYQEWHDKPVAFVGYSGGPSGGSSAIAQLRQVVTALGMVPVATEVKIPTAWKAFDANGKLVNKEALVSEITKMLGQLIKAAAPQ